MTDTIHGGDFTECLQGISALHYNPFDLLSRRNIEEKLIELLLEGVPPGPFVAVQALSKLAKLLLHEGQTEEIRVVVFGGGTGLSNVIGGDSRRPDWPEEPFAGLKSIFPETQSIVCITDDGGSTGEMMKDLPLIAVGDLRRVLLSSIQDKRLRALYGGSREEHQHIVEVLHKLFNCRYRTPPTEVAELVRLCDVNLAVLPQALRESLARLLSSLFNDYRLRPLLAKPHCLGNLLLVAAMYLFGCGEHEDSLELTGVAQVEGLRVLARIMGAHPEAVLPCTTTPAQLKILYAHGVLVTGEEKSAEAGRGYPVDRVFVEFCRPPDVLPEVIEKIENADILLFAPGSLYTSIIPIMQVPGLADAVRRNTLALKILIANLWVQRGETDVVREDPRRRFYISDLLKAYHRNIPGGVDGLFQHVLVLGLQNIQASILQSYAVEGKVPIYLDRGRVWEMGFNPIEARIFSKKALAEHRVVQHDPHALSMAIKTIWLARSVLKTKSQRILPEYAQTAFPLMIASSGQTPYERMEQISGRLMELAMDMEMREAVASILWRHGDIPYEHLQYIDGVLPVAPQDWERSQKWDKILSFYDPEDRCIKIQSTVDLGGNRFEAAFLIALGESLLGNYALEKENARVTVDGEDVGRLYRLTLREIEERFCYLNPDELNRYLTISRMTPSRNYSHIYTRLVNGNEGFSPPGLLFGLIYAWYLDSRFAAHIEYKMAILRSEVTDLIAEQTKMLERRKELIRFFRVVVFKQAIPREFGGETPFTAKPS